MEYKKDIEDKKNRVAEDFLNKFIFPELIKFSKESLDKNFVFYFEYLPENINIHRAYIIKRFKEENLNIKWYENRIRIDWETPHSNLDTKNKTLYAMLVENQRLLELNRNKELKKELQEYIEDVLYEEMKNAVCNKDYIDDILPDKFNSNFCKERIIDILKSGDVYAEDIGSHRLRIYLCYRYEEMKKRIESKTELNNAYIFKKLLKSAKKIKLSEFVNIFDISIIISFFDNKNKLFFNRKRCYLYKYNVFC